MKKDTWKQANPKDQVRVILGSIEANIVNLQELNFKEEKCQEVLKRIFWQLQEVKEVIVEYMPKGEWQSDSDEEG